MDDVELIIRSDRGRWATRQAVRVAGLAARQARTLPPWRAAEDVDHGPRLDAALGEQHQRVVQRGRRPRRPGRRGSRHGRFRPPRRPASFLAASSTSVASSATLRPARSTPPSSSSPCRSPRAASRRARRSSPTGPRARRSPAARRRSAVGAVLPVGVEAGPRPPVAGRARPGSTPEQQRVAVAVERERAEPQDVAATTRPCATGVPRDREWKCTSPVRERRGERLGVQPADHQHAAVGDVLDDARDEAVGVPRERGGIEAAVEVDGAGSRAASCGGPLADGADREARRGHRAP